MKRPKHTVFCPVANRQKQLFQTEAKAKLFMKFNPEVDIKRAYYCSACCGWHLTKTDHEWNDTKLVNAVIKKYKDTEDNIQVSLDLLNKAESNRDGLYNMMYAGKRYTKDEILNYINSGYCIFTKNQVRSICKKYELKI